MPGAHSAAASAAVILSSRRRAWDDALCDYLFEVAHDDVPLRSSSSPSSLWPSSTYWDDEGGHDDRCNCLDNDDGYDNNR